jgi:cell division septum initiation protein DivIVA
LHYSNSTGQRLDALEADVSGLKTAVSGGIVSFLLAVSLSSSQMKAMEKRQDAKAIAAEAKADAKAIAAEAKADRNLKIMNDRMSNMFFVTSSISIAVPFLMSLFSKKS